MTQRTPLHPVHVELGARMVDFGGWDMPVLRLPDRGAPCGAPRRGHVRRLAHVRRRPARRGVRELLLPAARQRRRPLKVPGKALYSCMLREDGGVIDDLIAYFIEEAGSGSSSTRARRDKDLEWIGRHAAQAGVGHRTPRPCDDRSPGAERPRPGRVAAAGGLPASACSRSAVLRRGGRRALRRAHGLHRRGRLRGDAAGGAGADLLARAQGGGRGVLRPRRARHAAPRGRHEPVRQRHGRGREPARVGARWTVASTAERDFIGRAALVEAEARGGLRRFVGLVLEDRGVLRATSACSWARRRRGRDHERQLVADDGALDRARAGAAGTGERVQVDLRGKLVSARVVKPPFVRNGQVLVTPDRARRPMGAANTLSAAPRAAGARR
jgi:aminomethyltransferase